VINWENYKESLVFTLEKIRLKWCR